MLVCIDAPYVTNIDEPVLMPIGWLIEDVLHYIVDDRWLVRHPGARSIVVAAIESHRSANC
jgi:hypothetical protein